MMYCNRINACPVKKTDRLLRLVLLAIFCSLVYGQQSYGRVILPSVIGDHMVLQRHAKVAIWGKSAPKKLVKVITSWNGQTYKAIASADSTWKVLVQTQEAGGPFSISFDDGALTTIKDILVGEVWVCSGQSNMEMPMWGFHNQPVLGANEILTESVNPDLRLIRYERALSRQPQFDGASTGWQISNPQVAGKFSAVGFQFALRLQQKLKIPVGIIMSTWGGTMIEGWMPRGSFTGFPNIKLKPASSTGRMNKNNPTLLYNGMINPFIGFGIKGVIWYQGEQNRCNPQIYDRLMKSMVTSWRQAWGIGDWPFYYVQIAPYQYKDTIGPASTLREAQLKASHEISNVGMVVSMDAGDRNAIHPRRKSIISQRLLYWALAKDYDYNGLAVHSPEYDAKKAPVLFKGSRGIIRLQYTERGLMTDGQPLVSFEMAGADRHFYPAQAKIKGKVLEIKSDKVAKPVAVRYGFKDYAACHLFNTEGLPAAPFRTDKWPVADLKQ